MHYFVSGIRGAAKEYFAMKQKIGFKADDELCIIGDIFDGNSAHPEDCLHILDDIMVSDNITLLLGDHEYSHVMYFLTNSEATETEEAAMWRSYIESPEFGGGPLFDYMTTQLSKPRYRAYMKYLAECQISKFYRIGSNVFYAVHGSPVICRNRDAVSWQYDAITIPTDPTKNYRLGISGDPFLFEFADKEKRLDFSQVFTITGHVPVSELLKNEKVQALLPKTEGDTASRFQDILFYNKNFAIDCGCSADAFLCEHEKWWPDLCVLGLDAVGFKVYHLLKD